MFFQHTVEIIFESILSIKVLTEIDLILGILFSIYLFVVHEDNPQGRKEKKEVMEDNCEKIECKKDESNNVSRSITTVCFRDLVKLNLPMVVQF